MAKFFSNPEILPPMKKLVLALLLIAVVTRFYALDSRPIDHDESIHAYLSFRLLNNHEYRYDPAYHGPFIYFSTAGIFGVFGDSKFTARLVPVVFSFIGIFFAARMKKFYSYAPVFALIMVFSPSILYYSRYLRNDMIVLSSFIAVIYSYFSYRLERKSVYIYLAVVFSAIMISSKENGYLYLGTLISFIFLRKLYKRDFSLDFQALRHLIPAIAIGGIIFTTLYTAGFSDMSGLKRATIDSFRHWFTMHEQKDHWKPIYYYAKLILQYEFLPLGMVLAGIPEFYERLKSRKISEFELFAFYWLVTAFLIYHVLSHKVPWLLVHLAAPMAFFGSIYARYLSMRGGAAIFAVLFVATAGMASYLTYVDSTNTDHDLIYIQAQPDIEVLAEKIKNFNGSVLIFVPGNDYWPLPWYLRHENLGYSSSYYQGYDVVVTSEDQIDFVKEKGYILDGKYTLRPGHDLYWLHKAQGG